MSKRAITVDDLRRIQFPGDPQAHPTNRTLTFTCKSYDGNQAFTRIGLMEPEGTVRYLTPADQRCGSPRWRPDGQALAFTSDRKDGIAQIFLLPMDGGEAEPLTKLPEGSLGEFKWSPDGKWIVATFRERAIERTKAAAKEREESHASDLPWVLDDIHYRLDGDGYFGADRYRLLVIDASTGDHRTLLADAPDGDYSFAWAPDSERLVVSHTQNHRPFFSPPDDVIRIVSLEGTSETLIGLPPGSKGSVAWSPDGTQIAYAGSTHQDDPWGTRNTRLFVTPTAGGGARCLTEDSPYDLGVATLSDTAEAAYGARVDWLDDASILVQIGWQGTTHPAIIQLDGTVRFLTEGPRIVSGGGLSGDRTRLGVAVNDPTHLPELGLLDLSTGSVGAQTSLNQSLAEEAAPIAPEELWLDSTPNKDGSPSRLQAWVVRPPQPNGAAILEIHGGPHTQYGWAFFHEFQVLAAAGYTVYYSNPRGSKGYGEAYCAEIHGDWGHKDWEDIETLTNFVRSDAGIDPERIAVMGGSYGGYMTNWAVGHSKAYRTAITDRCVSNLVSMSGNSDFPFNRDAYFKGSAYGDLESIRELWRQSPLAYFEQAETPMLIIHSEGDLRCNVEQGEQVFTALQEKGIRSRFVRYPRNSSHGLSRSGPIDLRLHRLNEILRWYAETL